MGLQGFETWMVDDRGGVLWGEKDLNNPFEGEGIEHNRDGWVNGYSCLNELFMQGLGHYLITDSPRKQGTGSVEASTNYIRVRRKPGTHKSEALEFA